MELKMRLSVCGSVVCFLLMPLGLAQDSPQQIKAGARLRVELQTPLSTRYSTRGEAVQASLSEPLAEQGELVIPVGAILSGHVDAVQPSDRRQKLRSSLRLLFDTIGLPNQRVLRCDAVVEYAGFNFKVDSNGTLTRPGISVDFELKKGRKLWLSLQGDLSLGNAEVESAATARTVSGVVAQDSVSQASNPAEVHSATLKTSSGKVPKVQKNDKYSVRMGEFLITAISVGTNFETDSHDSRFRIPAHHHFVVVRVKVKNVGKHFPCTSLGALLKVSPYFEYHPDWGISDGLPEVQELLPGEEAGGTYAFRVKDGTTPIALLLKADEIRDRRSVEHPDWGAIWHARDAAELSL